MTTNFQNLLFYCSIYSILFTSIFLYQQIEFMITKQTNFNLLTNQFQHKLKDIDQIAQLAIQQRQKKISQKYGNIQSTAKLLKSLIVEFTKKSIKIQEDLRQRAHIQDLVYQTDYHKKRLDVCLTLSQNLERMIEKKKDMITRYEEESNKLKNELILIKTQNIKKILKGEMIEKKQKQIDQKQNKEKKLETIKEKMYKNRVLIQTGLNYLPSILENLKKQKHKVSAILFEKISIKLGMRQLVRKDYQKLKIKLLKQQKKSNIYGLKGSLLFKLEENKLLENKIGLNLGSASKLNFGLSQKTQAKSKYHKNYKQNVIRKVSRKNVSDAKLLIYDILKQKYTNQIKIQKQKQNQIILSQEIFLNFSPIQIIGLIELKGGLFNLKKYHPK